MLAAFERNAMTQWLLNFLFSGLYRRLAEMESNIMGAIENFASAVTDKLGQISLGLENIYADVDSLHNQIEALQNSLGNVTPEQQALLDGITATVNGIADKVGDIDTKTPPVS